MKHETSQDQIQLFAVAPEKGSREWRTFNPVQNDHVPGAYRVLSPRNHSTPRYPNVVHINRYPRHLTPRLAQ